ncbi:BLUF domain-containing protein [Aurantiacibacter suaedae]|uniref:BLUF domain-containing protein n=1 Tax=Aurantiacibacter suaedae TaxID=2545755 RepID=UPI0010F65E6A|nr:BLUF domain-containing protein [Aurantiacibacter suaedae]
MPLTRLLYTSTSCLPEQNGLTVQVNAIAQQAAERNEKCAVTGVLVFIENQFIQVLEGGGPEIEETFERICCDLRHKSVRLIDLVVVKERMFPCWKMQLLSDKHETTLELRDDLETISFLVGVNAKAAVEKIRKCLDAQESTTIRHNLVC